MAASWGSQELRWPWTLGSSENEEPDCCTSRTFPSPIDPSHVLSLQPKGLSQDPGPEMEKESILDTLVQQAQDDNEVTHCDFVMIHQ